LIDLGAASIARDSPATVFKRNLVLSRVGKDHRLHGLLGIDPSVRNWDLAFSIYDENLQFQSDDCIDYVHHAKGGKWDGIYAFFQAYPEALDAYDYFWLVDDDIEATASQVDSLFRYVSAHAFEIAQPALTLDSYYSHRLTLQCPKFAHRYTNFVELMLPVLSRTILKQALPLFRDSRSGLGIDWMWYRFASRPHESVAIIDFIAMPHRRPLNRHLRGRMKLDGVCAMEERASLVGAWQQDRVYPIAFAGKRLTGMAVDSRFNMSFDMTRAYWSARGLMSGKHWRFVDYLIFAFRQAFSKP